MWSLRLRARRPKKGVQGGVGSEKGFVGCRQGSRAPPDVTDRLFVMRSLQALPVKWWHCMLSLSAGTSYWNACESQIRSPT